MADALIMRKGGAGGSLSSIKGGEIALKSDTIIDKSSFIQIERELTANKQNFGTSTAYNIRTFKSGDKIIAFATLSTKLCIIIYSVVGNTITYLNKDTNNLFNSNVGSYVVEKIDDKNFILFSQSSSAVKYKTITINDDNTITRGTESTISFSTTTSYLFDLKYVSGYYYLLKRSTDTVVSCVKIAINNTASVVDEINVTDFGTAGASYLVNTNVINNNLFVAINRQSSGAYIAKINTATFTVSGTALTESAIRAYSHLITYNNLLYFITKITSDDGYKLHTIALDLNLNIIKENTGNFTYGLDDFNILQISDNVLLLTSQEYSYYSGTYRGIEGYVPLSLLDGDVIESGYLHADVSTDNGIKFNYTSNFKEQISYNPCIIIYQSGSTQICCAVVEFKAKTVISNINGINTTKITPTQAGKVIV